MLDRDKRTQRQHRNESKLKRIIYDFFDVLFGSKTGRFRKN